jgi:transcription antitermination factor NusG
VRFLSVRTPDCGSIVFMRCSSQKIELDAASPERPQSTSLDIDVSVESSAERREWFAIAVKPRHEKSVAHVLDTKGYETFVPLYKHRHRHAARLRDFELPLFPGYVFSRFNLFKRLPVMVTPGVSRILGFGPNPTPMDPVEIASLRTTLDKALSAKTLPFLQTGNKVRICEGPLHGVEGIIVLVRGAPRIVLSATLLQRSVLVEVDSSWLLPAAAPQVLEAKGPGKKVSMLDQRISFAGP